MTELTICLSFRIQYLFIIPPKNRVSEHKNCTLMEMARCMLKDIVLHNAFWREAICTATCIQNCIQPSYNDWTPYEKWTRCKPDLSNIETFSNRVFAYVWKIHRIKLENAVTEGLFLGYIKRSKGYRNFTDGKKIIISRTIKFLEDKTQDIHENSVSNKNSELPNYDNPKPKLQLLDDNFGKDKEKTEVLNANSDNATTRKRST